MSERKPEEKQGAKPYQQQYPPPPYATPPPQYPPPPPPYAQPYPQPQYRPPYSQPYPQPQYAQPQYMPPPPPPQQRVPTSRPLQQPRLEELTPSISKLVLYIGIPLALIAIVTMITAMALFPSTSDVYLPYSSIAFMASLIALAAALIINFIAIYQVVANLDRKIESLTRYARQQQVAPQANQPIPMQPSPQPYPQPERILAPPQLRQRPQQAPQQQIIQPPPQPSQQQVQQQGTQESQVSTNEESDEAGEE